MTLPILLAFEGNLLATWTAVTQQKTPARTILSKSMTRISLLYRLFSQIKNISFNVINVLPVVPKEAASPCQLVHEVVERHCPCEKDTV